MSVNANKKKQAESPAVRILVCPNAFKGSLTAAQAAQAVAEGIARGAEGMGTPADGSAKTRRVETIRLPLADGGDGTLETLVEATDGALFTRAVRGPLGEPVTATWGRLGGTQRDTAIIEMAEASGLRLLRPEQYDPRRATTYGTGELMRAALEAGCRTLLLGIGGSATNDGGAGMAQALGCRLLDADGRDLPPGGAALARLARIDRSGCALPPGVTVRVACDVDNPLLGPEGASAVYGPQKGATPEMVTELEAALAHYADVLRAQLGVDVVEVPGAGAAGGLGAGLTAFCGAKLMPGTEMILDAVGFDEKVRGCALVVTGEGKLDAQTVRGKVIAGTAKRAKAAGVPAIALVGALEPEAEAPLREEGLTAAFSIVPGPLTVEEAMRDAYRLLAGMSERLFRLLTLRL
jgi:glycerate kinase